MTIQVIGASGTIQEVDPTFESAVSTLRPDDAINQYCISLKCTGMTGFAASAGLLAFRNGAENPIAVRRLTMQVVVTTAFASTIPMMFSLKKLVRFTTVDTGGNFVRANHQNKVREDMVNSGIFPDIKISNTGTALTAGTGNLETNALSVAIFNLTGVGGVSEKVDLFNCKNGGMPLIFAKNEGFRVRTEAAFAATGVATAYFVLTYSDLV